MNKNAIVTRKGMQPKAFTVYQKAKQFNPTEE
jgi:hypothetical protein